MMGHASIQITIDLYTHLWPGRVPAFGTLLDQFIARSDTDSRLEQIEVAS